MPSNAVLGFHHVARAGKEERGLRVGHRHHGFEPAQIFVRAPILAEFHAGAREIARMLLELGFQPLEQRKRIGGRAGKTRDHVALAETAHLAGIGLHDRLAERHLPIARDDDRSRPCGRRGLSWSASDPLCSSMVSGL